MKTWLLMIALLFLATGTALADVTNEVIVGFEFDGTSKVKDGAGNDITDTMKVGNSLFTLQYSHFFSPIKDDEKPIELHRFYQHPSSLSIGLFGQGFAERDSTNPIFVRETKRGTSMIVLGGEWFLSTGTGLFLNIGGGSGKEEITTPLSKVDTDLNFSMLGFGVRQYIGPEFMMHLRLQGDTVKAKQGSLPEETSDESIVYFGVRGVIRDTLSLAAEIGGGEQNIEHAGATTKYDIGALNLEGAVYVGKELSFRLAIDTESRKTTTFSNNTIKRARTTLAARYWFSEKVGLELPLYAETTKDDLLGDMTSNGFGLYGTFRF